MTLDEIKQINIREYLGQMNIHPVKDYGYYGMYHCPYREDSNASFKVDYQRNLWYDFGTNEGGSIIDLIMRINNCSLNDAVIELSGCTNIQSNQQSDDCMYKYSNVAISQHRNDNSFTIQNIIPITHPKLIEWVEQRQIDLNLANLYCREVHYQNQSGQFFSIGFGNDKGGYELSSPNGFKGCFPPKDIKTFRNDNNDSCLVFEGFWDFLSYLVIQKVEKTKHDVVVLNSVANVEKAMDFLKRHGVIYTYLDNDDAGRKATKLIQSVHSNVYNRSTQYNEYKDLNDYLCGKKQAVKQEIQKKKSGLKIH